MSDKHVDNRAIDTYEEISLRELIETLWKGKVLVAITTVIALLLASVVTFFVLPEKYNAAVVLRANQIKLSNTYSGEDAAAFADLENKLLLSTSQYAEMLAKEDFLEQLSASLSLKNPDGTVVTGEALGALIATQTNDSASTITVTVTDSDPDRAFLIAEGIENDFITFINKFVNTNVDLYTTTLSNNLNMAKTALDTKEEALSVFRRENGNIDLLTDEVNRLQARIKEINQNISMYESSLDSDLASLDTLIEELQAEGEISSEQVNIIAELREAIESENGSGNQLDSDVYLEANLSGSNGQISQSVRIVELNKLQMRLLNNFNLHASATSQLSETEEMFQAKQQELTEMQPVYATYKSEYDIAMSTYTSYLKKMTAAAVYKDLDVASSFITEITAPVLPKSPVSPNKLLNLAVAFVIGLILGVFIVFAREYWKSSAPATKK